VVCFHLLLLHSRGETEVNYEIPQPIQSASRPKFEPGPNLIQAEAITLEPNCSARKGGRKYRQMNFILCIGQLGWTDSVNVPNKKRTQNFDGNIFRKSLGTPRKVQDSIELAVNIQSLGMELILYGSL
jgi:hypothetical protein